MFFMLPTVYAEEPVDSLKAARRFRTQYGLETIAASLIDADIPTIRAAIDRRLVTCEEVMTYYLKRIEAYNKAYNCFITMCDEEALALARAQDDRLARGEAEGDLFGIPIVVKDNIDYVGYPTTNGYAKNPNAVAKKSADVVAQLVAEGAIVIGKTNMSAGAQSASCSISVSAGETKNAYSTLLASGGSSGGSAAAVALNFAAAGLGTDTSSSLRYPAILNGCVSMRTTFGALPMDGVKLLNRTRDVIGVITETVYEQAVMLDAMAGGSTEYANNLNAHALEGLRIGTVKQLCTPQKGTNRSEANMDDEVMAAFEQALRDMEACGAEIVEVSIPNLLNEAYETRLNNSSALKKALYQKVSNVMAQNEVAVLVCPTYLNTPLRSGTDENGTKWNPYTQVFLNNCADISPSTGMPEIAVPIGYHSLGAGIGMEITALKSEEQLLLDVAYSYTQQYDHHVQPAGADDLHVEEREISLAELVTEFDLYLKKLAEPPVNSSPSSVEPVQSESASSASAESNRTESTAVSSEAKKTEPNPIYISWEIIVAGAATVLLIGGIVVAAVLRHRKKAAMYSGERYDESVK